MSFVFTNPSARMMPLDRNMPGIQRYESYGSVLDVPQIVQRWGYSPGARKSYLTEVIGVDHTSHPADIQFEVLRNEFALWERETHGEPRITLCEGRVPELAASEHESIQTRGGEQSWLRFVADRAGIETDTWERPIPEQVARLGVKHDRSPLFYYLIARQQPPLDRAAPHQPEAREAYIRDGLVRTVGRYAVALADDWPRFDFSYEHFKQLHSQLYPRVPLNILNTRFFRDETVTNMYDPYTKVQGVSYDMNRVRNDDLVNATIRHGKHEGKHVFALIGFSHIKRLVDIV